MTSARKSADHLISSPATLNRAAASANLEEATSLVASAVGADARDHKDRPLTVRVTSTSSERIDVQMLASGQDGVAGTDDDIVAEMAFVWVDRWVIDHIDCIRNGSR